MEDHGIIVKHIDNTLRHEVVCPTKTFLQQTENSIDNLLKIAELVKPTHSLEKSIALLRTYQKLKKLRIVWLYRLFYKISKKIILKNLYSARPKIRLFDLYKLGYLCEKRR